MKISERASFEDHMLVVHQKHDVTATLKRAEKMRHAFEAGHRGNIPDDWVPVGIVPAVMQRVWADEAGVRMDDSEAMNEVLNKKLLSGEFRSLQIMGD